jgi:hypothetical protein
MDFADFFDQEYLKNTDIQGIKLRDVKIIRGSDKKGYRSCQSPVIEIYYIITVDYG